MIKHWNKFLTSDSIDNTVILVQRHLSSLNSIEEMGATGKEMLRTVAPDAAVCGVFDRRKRGGC
jgi:hypothetical protein